MTADHGASLSGVKVAQVGQEIVVSGSGWKDKNGGGSVAAVKLDGVLWCLVVRFRMVVRSMVRVVLLLLLRRMMRVILWLGFRFLRLIIRM